MPSVPMKALLSSLLSLAIDDVSPSLRSYLISK